jgi:hypothetical protein
MGISYLNALLQTVSSAEVPLLAAVGGEIVERLISPGQVVQADATQCFMISNPGFLPFSRHNPETAMLWSRTARLWV